MNSGTENPTDGFDLDALENGIRARDIACLGRAITLLESQRPDHQVLAEKLLNRFPHAGSKTLRIGITGIPGVGKSTFIDSLGSFLIEAGHRVAVLAVDPTSLLSGGSILADKTRMCRLAGEPNAFIRPSPSSGNLGGAAVRTREAVVVCEAAGFDTIIIETVGVGQSETAVADMVDFFLVLMLTGAGDELQGIKRGILEAADLVAINKADGDNVTPARLAQAELQAAIHMTHPRQGSWVPSVVTCSALKDEGIAEIWSIIDAYRIKSITEGLFADKRRQQLIQWMWQGFDYQLINDVHSSVEVQQLAEKLKQALAKGETTPRRAINRLMQVALGKTVG